MKFWQHIPPLRAMLAVEATARHGSFSKAASELNVTQSAVSHLVSQAEGVVNTQLFQRQLRPVQLTSEGRRFVDAIVAGLNMIQAEGEALQRSANSNTLTVSCNLAYASFWLLPRLKEFHDLQPEVTVNVVTAYQGLPPLTTGIDLSVRFGSGAWPETEARLQEMTGDKVRLIFTPHLTPMIRGMHSTLYAQLNGKGLPLSNEALQALFEDAYKGEPFVDVMPFGSTPDTRSTRGSNVLRIALHRPRFLHAKHLSVDDDVALIGSINLDIRSFALNAEVGLLSYDAGVVARLQAIEAARLAESDLVDPAQWARRPRWQRTRDGIARLADSVL